MSGMAEVLEAHRTMNFSKERYCMCGAYLGDWATLGDFAAHQAAMLTAAGFGPVKEAGYEWGCQIGGLIYPHDNEAGARRDAAFKHERPERHVVRRIKAGPWEIAATAVRGEA